jgi:hypothetical protein
MCACMPVCAWDFTLFMPTFTAKFMETMINRMTMDSYFLLCLIRPLDLLTLSGTAAFFFVVKQQTADPALIFILDTQAAQSVNGKGSNSQQGKGSLHPPPCPHLLNGPYSLIYNVYQEIFLQGQSSHSMKLMTHLNPVLCLRKCETLHFLSSAYPDGRHRENFTLNFSYGTVQHFCVLFDSFG